MWWNVGGKTLEMIVSYFGFNRERKDWQYLFIKFYIFGKRRIYVVTKTGEEWFYAKWDIVQEQLKKYKFFFCHNSYFVHLKYVRGLTATNIRMENGEELSISRSRQKEVMEYISINKRY